MAGGEVDDAAATKETPDATGGFPRLVQLLARQTCGMTCRSSYMVQKCIAGKATEVVIGQSIARRWRETHTGGYRGRHVRRLRDRDSVDHGLFIGGKNKHHQRAAEEAEDNPFDVEGAAEMFEAMWKYNEELVKAGICSPLTGSSRASSGSGCTSTAQNGR
jgi:hypothetical protein